MTITDSLAAPAAKPSALQRYERAISLDGITYIPWAVLAIDLRAEAGKLTGCAAQKRVDRAEDCERRTRRPIEGLLAATRSQCVADDCRVALGEIDPRAFDSRAAAWQRCESEIARAVRS